MSGVAMTYLCAFKGEIYDMDFNSPEEARDLFPIIARLKHGDKFMIGEKVMYAPGLNADAVIDCIMDLASEEGNEDSHGFLLDVEAGDLDDLKCRLQATFMDWVKEKDFVPELVTIEDEEEYEYDGTYGLSKRTDDQG